MKRRQWSNRTSKWYIWIGNLFEVRGTTNLYYIYAGSRRVCVNSPALKLPGASGNSDYNYYHPDPLGSSSVMTDSTSAQVENYTYTAYGRERANGAATPDATHRFTGQVFDYDTGLYYYGARYYDPELARFVQPDNVIPSLWNPQSWNRYSYVLNNPLRNVDPDGRSALSVFLDAMFNTETISSSHQLLQNGLADQSGWRYVTIPVAVAAMGVAAVDAGFNVATLGGKSAVTGTVKEGSKALLKEGLEVVGKKSATIAEGTTKGITKEAGEVGTKAASEAGGKEGSKAAGETAAERTAVENRKARNQFKNNKDAAKRAWEERTGREWPKDANGKDWPAHHEPPLKSGGDPMHVQPQSPKGPAIHTMYRDQMEKLIISAGVRKVLRRAKPIRSHRKSYV